MTKEGIPSRQILGVRRNSGVLIFTFPTPRATTNSAAMPAPTALQASQPPADMAGSEELLPQQVQSQGDASVLDPTAASSPPDQPLQPPADESAMQIDTEGRPQFAPASEAPPAFLAETRKVPIPPHRFTPLKNSWTKIYPPLVNHLKLQGNSLDSFCLCSG